MSFYKKLFFVTALVFFIFSAKITYSVPIPLPVIDIGVRQAETPEDVSATLQIIILLTILTLAPAILILMTSFTRIIVVLSFLRNALGTQQMPPNQVLVGLALFLTFYIMSPVFTQISNDALDPYFDKKISIDEAFELAKAPIHRFLISHTREKDI